MRRPPGHWPITCRISAILMKPISYTKPFWKKIAPKQHWRLPNGPYQASGQRLANISTSILLPSKTHFYSVLLESIVDEQQQGRDKRLTRFLERAPEKSPENPGFSLDQPTSSVSPGKHPPKCCWPVQKIAAERTEAISMPVFQRLTTPPPAIISKPYCRKMGLHL